MNQTEMDNIGKHTRVTLPILIAAVGLAISSGVEYSSLRADISDLKKSQWTVTDHLAWSLEFKSENPGLTVPILPQQSHFSENTNLFPYLAQARRFNRP